MSVYILLLLFSNIVIIKRLSYYIYIDEYTRIFVYVYNIFQLNKLHSKKKLKTNKIINHFIRLMVYLCSTGRED